ncbi:MAG TPA: hypothetical protein VLT16_19060, partial [Candidatus Limnocylindrales bacterium]|nr:hypothetical protein [Candidatus Limnocylindrales bacterium]
MENRAVLPQQSGKESSLRGASSRKVVSSAFTSIAFEMLSSARGLPFAGVSLPIPLSEPSVAGSGLNAE